MSAGRNRQPNRTCAIASGHEVVIANSRGPDTLNGLVADFGPSARAATVVEAAAAGDFVVPRSPPQAGQQHAGGAAIPSQNVWRGFMTSLISTLSTIARLANPAQRSRSTGVECARVSDALGVHHQSRKSDMHKHPSQAKLGLRRQSPFDALLQSAR